MPAAAGLSLVVVDVPQSYVSNKPPEEDHAGETSDKAPCAQPCELIARRRSIIVTALAVGGEIGRPQARISEAARQVYIRNEKRFVRSAQERIVDDGAKPVREEGDVADRVAPVCRHVAGDDQESGKDELA